MPFVTFMPSGKKIKISSGANLLECSRGAGIEIDAPCGGKGTCGKCLVRIASGTVQTDSLGVLNADEVADGFVLACKTKVGNSALVVEVPELANREGGKFISAEDDVGLVRQDLLPCRWQFDPLAIKWLVQVKPPLAGDGHSDLDRLNQAIAKHWGNKKLVYTLPVLRELPLAVRSAEGQVTVTIIREPEEYHVIRVEAGDTTYKHFGIAVDVGTTTIAVQMVYLPEAQVIGTMTDYNEQISCGLDVISRINYAATTEHLLELREKVLKTINRLIERLVKLYQVDVYDICNVIISGNTTMTHLLLGIKPEYIRLDPYTPAILHAPYLTAAEIGIKVNPQSWIFISPCIGSYVGGDITAGILCTELATESEAISLFIDIGTNGEIVIGNSQFMMTCACSAGPAFEGGGIKYGMRAALGAIEHIDIDATTGIASYQTIGDIKPRGICGSGIISLLAKLLLTGWIDQAGKLSRTRISSAIKISGRFAEYVIVTADESENGDEITISESDFENIIRTKAAIYSASALVLKQLDMSFDDLSNIYIAGGFGRFLDLEMAIVIGLLPDADRSKFKYIGNSSLTGSYMILISQEFKERQAAIATRMTYVDLSSDPQYMNEYTSAMFLPHTDIDLFPSIKTRLQKP
jgi:uncharacterized 2Fe-2S/4Fe-4S cluster protein (DUF4445 family)